MPTKKPEAKARKSKSKGKHSQKKILNTYSYPEDLPQKERDILDNAVDVLKKHNAEGDAVLRWLSAILVKLSKNKPGDSPNKYLMYPVLKYPDMKEFARHLEAVQLLSDTIFLSTPNSKLIDTLKQSLLGFIKTQHPETMKQVRAIGKQNKTYFANSVTDLDTLISLTRYHLAELALKPEEKKETKKERVKKISNDSQLLAAFMALRQIQVIKEYQPEDKSSDIPVAYYFLLGTYFASVINPLQSMHDEIRRLFVHISSSEGGRKRRERVEPLKEEARSIADNLYSQGDRRMHNEMAQYIFEEQKKSHAEIRGSLEFTKEDFIPPMTVTGLCEAIRKDKFKLKLNSPDNTVERLNELLRALGFYHSVEDVNRTISDSLPKQYRYLIYATSASRGEINYQLLERGEQERIVKLNRILLKTIYPEKVPDLPEKDISKYYTVNVVRKAISKIAFKYGRERGAH